MMDQELQWLIKNLYGDRQLTDLQLSSLTKLWESNHMGFRDNMKNAVLNKIKQDTKAEQTEAAKLAVMSKANFLTPSLGLNSYKFDKSLGRAVNDMSAIADFKQAFRQARQGGHKTFFWKKTKANPSGMFSTEIKPQGYDGSVKVNNSRVFLDIDKTDMPAFTGLPAEQFDVTSPRIPVQGPLNHEQIDDPNFVPRIPIQGKTDLGIFSKASPAEVNITGNSTRIAGRRYGEGQKNANLYFGRKGAGMFSGGGNISQQSTPLIGNSGASVADVITVINSKDMNAIQELFSSIGLEGFEQAIRSIQQMAKEGDGSAMQALQTLLELMLGSQKAKLGTKLNYIQKLKGICPEGTEKIYLRNGGCMCGQKAKKGAELKKEQPKNEIQKFKAAKGCKTKKRKK